MDRRKISRSLIVLLALPFSTSAAEPESLSMTPAVVCEKIRGFEDYDVLDEAAYTSDEKMLVYFRPLNYKIEPDKAGFRAHFIQEGKIRKRGRKEVLWSREKLLDYEAKSKQPPRAVYLSNTVGFKGLPPGEYDYDIVLRDALEKEATATQTVRFKIVTAASRAKPDTPRDDPEKPKP